MPQKTGMLSDDCVTHKATVPARGGWGPVTRMSQPRWVTSSWSTENMGTPNVPGAQKQPQGSCRGWGSRASHCIFTKTMPVAINHHPSRSSTRSPCAGLLAPPRHKVPYKPKKPNYLPKSVG